MGSESSEDKWGLVRSGPTTIARYSNRLVRRGVDLAALVQTRPAALSEKLTASDHENAVAHYKLGIALSNKGQLDEAIAEYRKAIEFDPNYKSAHYILGNALFEKGQLDDAIAEYRKAIELDPNHEAAHNHLGIALDEKG